MLHPETPPEDLKNAMFFQSGSAFFNLPFYLAAYLIESLCNVHYDFNGITLKTASINVASNFYLAAALILMVGILKKLRFKYIALPILSVLFSTSAIVSAVILPSFNHSADLFVLTLFLSVFLDNLLEKRDKRLFWLGALYVIAILVRYFNFVLLAPVLAYYLFTRNYEKIKFFLLGVISTIWLVPLIMYTYNHTPSPFFNTKGAFVCIPNLFFLPRYLLKCLLHPLHGLFAWSPVLILSAFGLVMMPKDKEKIGYLFIGIWFSYLTAYGFLYSWHAGWSFSNRYFTHLFPIFIIGVAAFMERFGRKAVLPVLAATAYSVFLYLNWQLCIMHGEFGTPADMLKAWIKGQSESFVDKKVNFSTFFNRLLEYCRYKYIFRIFR